MLVLVTAITGIVLLVIITVVYNILDTTVSSCRTSIILTFSLPASPTIPSATEAVPRPLKRTLTLDNQDENDGHVTMKVRGMLREPQGVQGSEGKHICCIHCQNWLRNMRNGPSSLKAKEPLTNIEWAPFPCGSRRRKTLRMTPNAGIKS